MLWECTDLIETCEVRQWDSFFENGGGLKKFLNRKWYGKKKKWKGVVCGGG